MTCFSLLIGLGKVLVNPGEYEETFQCFLPLNLPTSVESKDAYNRYSASAVLDERFLQIHVIKKRIILVRPLDLNDYLNLLVYEFCMLIELSVSYRFIQFGQKSC